MCVLEASQVVPRTRGGNRLIQLSVFSQQFMGILGQELRRYVSSAQISVAVWQT